MNEQVMAVRLEDVVSVYSGKDGRCCCGCSGKHYIATAHRVEGCRRVGFYDTDAVVCNDVQVRRVMRIIQKTDSAKMSDGFVEATVGGRLYIAYLRDLGAK